MLDLIDAYVAAQAPAPLPAPPSVPTDAVPSGMRRCRKCGDVMPLASFQETKPGGVPRRQCVYCIRELRRRIYHRDKARKAAEAGP